MLKEERERMERLVQQIQVEKDKRKFTELVSELNALLAQKNQRLDRSGTSTK